MGHVPWFNLSRLFDYDLQEELGELEEGVGFERVFFLLTLEKELA